MRSLFLFIIKYHFFFLFLILESASLVLVIKHNNRQNTYFNEYSGAVFAKIYGVTSSINQYFNLKNVNAQLSEENAFLRQQLLQSKYSNKITVSDINDTLFEQKYSYFTASVIKNSVHLPQNYITIDKGWRHGIEKDMAVISPKGIVGIVKSVSENYSKVLTVLHSQFKISGKLTNNNYFGALSWNGKNYKYAQLSEIPYHVKINVGDTLITNEYSNIYPGGIVIGTIEDFEKSDNDNFYSINIKLSTDFKNLEYVYVVKDFHKTEREILEEIIP